MEPSENWTIITNNGRKTVVAFFPDADEPLQTASTESHGNFDAIVSALEGGDPEAYDHFDPQRALSKAFSQITDRVSVKGGRVFFDLVEADGVIADHMVRTMNEGGTEDDLKASAMFMERLAANPSEHSREHLFKWLAAEDFTITNDGKIVGYKGVQKSNGEFASTMRGPAVVDGKPVNGYVPNVPGSVVQMPRDQVTFDPAVSCSSGLHVGTWAYAKSFGSYTLEVEVDPADVVSVPVDSRGQKMRVWRYKVIKEADAKYGQAVKPLEDYYEDDDYEEYYDDPDASDGF